jgi:hypothetical protein
MPATTPDALPPDDLSEIATLLGRAYICVRKSRSLAVVEDHPPPAPPPKIGLASLADQSVHVNGG